ncbi:hypothetical protein NL676_010164 [Syzygium grande]|nr:hypothetical protein NL676_010164 [Syzygium grande]
MSFRRPEDPESSNIATSQNQRLCSSPIHFPFFPRKFKKVGGLLLGKIRGFKERGVYVGSSNYALPGMEIAGKVLALALLPYGFGPARAGSFDLMRPTMFSSSI